MKYLVYKLTRADEKQYIGITSQKRFKVRLQEHKHHKRFRNKKFVHTILAKTDSYDEARELEEFFINKYNTYKEGLNKTKDGSGHNYTDKFTTRGYKHTDETKRKIGDAHKGKIPWNKGIKNCHSLEAREKMSKANIGKVRHSKLSVEDNKNILDLYKSRNIKLNNVGKRMPNGRNMSYFQAFSLKIAPEYNVTPQCIHRLLKKHGHTTQDKY